MSQNIWPQETVQTLLRFHEILNTILLNQLQGRLILRDAERAALARLAHEIGRPALAQHPVPFHPDTLLRWWRDLCAKAHDFGGGGAPGRPSPWRVLSGLVERMATENPGWGAARVHGQLKALGYTLSLPTTRRLFKRLGIDPDRQRTTPGRWSDFLDRHRAVAVATDFFTAHILVKGRAVPVCGLFFIHLDTRKVELAGLTQHPDEAWMKQIARNLTMPGGFLEGRKLLLMDRDAKYCRAFRDILRDAGVQPLRLSYRSPNLNAYAERWVRTLKEECLRHFIPDSMETLRRIIRAYREHYHLERAHQGLGNTIPFRAPNTDPPPHPNLVRRKSTLGGLLNFYCYENENAAQRAA